MDVLAVINIIIHKIELTNRHSLKLKPNIFLSVKFGKKMQEMSTKTIIAWSFSCYMLLGFPFFMILLRFYSITSEYIKISFHIFTELQ